MVSPVLPTSLGTLPNVDETSLLLDAIDAPLYRAEAAGALDWLASCKVVAQRLEPRGLLIPPGPLRALSLCLLLGEVALHGGRGDATGELGDHRRAGQLLRLVDSLPVGY